MKLKEIENLCELKEMLNKVPDEILINWGIANNELSDMEVEVLRMFPTDLDPLKDDEAEGLKLAGEETTDYPQITKVMNWLKAIKKAIFVEFNQDDVDPSGEFIHYSK